MRPTLIPSLLLVLLTALAFWPARTATFLHYDDPIHVTKNPYILPPTLDRLAYFWRYPFDRTPVPGVASDAGLLMAPYRAIYSPLAFTVWGLLVYPARVVPLQASSDTTAQTTQQTAFTLDPSIYHSFNLTLHVINVLLMFALLRQFVKSIWAAAIGAAVFAVHPVQVEPVAWVTGMNNLLSGLFVLAALLFYLKNKDAGEKPRWWTGTYLISTLCFLLSVLSKPSSVTLPVLALLLCWGLGETKWRTRLMEMIPWLGIVLFCIVTNILVSRGNSYDLKPMSWQKPFLVGDALTFYAGKLLWPLNLAPDYGRRPQWVMQQPLTYVVWLLPLGAFWGAWQWWRRSSRSGQDDELPRITLMSLALFATVLLPSSGIVTYYFHGISTVSDRYMYMALIGPAILVAVLASRVLQTEKLSSRCLAAGVGLALMVAMTFHTFRQTELWQSDLPIWQHNVAIVPQSTVAYYQYGVALYDGGNYKAAIPILEKALQVTPANWSVEASLGNAYVQIKELQKAEFHYRRALELSPDFINARLGLGVVLSQQGKVAEAIDQFGRGLQLQPQNPLLLAYMGQNLTTIGKAKEGANFVRSALAYGFEPARGHLYLGNALARSGDVTAAMNEWYASVQVNPNMYEAFFNMGNAASKAGNTGLAIQCFEHATQIQPNSALAQVQLGLEWQKQKQLVKARNAFLAALKSDPNNARALKALKALGGDSFQ